MRAPGNGGIGITDEHMHDLHIRALPGGAFELEQQAGSLEEPAAIHLHPAQVRLLAERAGLLPRPDPKLIDRLSSRHVWCLRALVDRLDEIRRFYLDEIFDHCASSVEISLHLRALEDLADELLLDVGGNAGCVTPTLPVTSNEKSAESASISVTSPAPKRGRPTTGIAMTNAERQARHREKQPEVPRQDALPWRENVHA